MIPSEHNVQAENLYTFSAISRLGRLRKRSQLELIAANVLPPLNPPAAVLEVGAGRGEFADMVTARGLSYVGIEPSQALGQALRARGFSILAAAIPRIPMSDASVSLVYSYDVLEHLDGYPTILEYFSEAHRVLQPGGYIVTIAPNAETIGNLFWLYEYQHSFVTTLDRVASLLRDSRFEIVSSFAFLTELGLTRSRIARACDRILAHTVLLGARSSLMTAVLRACLGRRTVSQIHKNLFDHIVLVARRS